MPKKNTLRVRTLGAAPALLCAVLCAFAFCAYIPTISYLSNIQFYSFSLSQLLWGMLPAFAIVLAGLSLPLFAFSRLLWAKSSQRLRKTPKAKGLVTPLHVVLILLVFCVWLEGSPLSRGLPRLTGETGVFNSIPRAIADSAVWAAVLIIGIVFWRAIAKRFIVVSAGVSLLLGLGIGDAILNRPPQTDAARATANEVLDRAAFHPDDNVLILVLDAMSTAAVQDYLAESPASQETFDGFVFYQNNMESADSTQWSLPSMLKGDIYAGGPVLEYQSSLYDAPESLVRKFRDEGYDIYASSTLPLYNRYMLSQTGVVSAARRAISVPRTLYNQFLVKFAPYALKNAVSNRAGISGMVNTTANLQGGNLEELEELEPANSDEITYLALIQASAKKNSTAPTFHFHHVNGAHKPYTTASRGDPLPASQRETLYGLRQQSAWTLQYVEELLQSLKDNGLYDASAIVLLGDHGDRLYGEHYDEPRDNLAYAQRASLMIKPAGSRGPLARSPAPTSNMYLRDFVSALHLEGESLDSLTAGLPIQRSVLVGGTALQVYEGADVTALSLIASTAVEQEYTPNPLALGTQYSLSTLSENMDIAYPLAYENANYTNGWGLRALEERMEFSCLVAAAPGQTVDVALEVSTAALAGGEREFDPYKITLRDEISGKEATFTISSARMDIRLDEAIVADDSSVQLSVSISSYPGPAMQVLTTAITVDASAE